MLTVRGEMESVLAIALLDLPSATERAISVSREVSPAAPSSLCTKGGRASSSLNIPRALLSSLRAPIVSKAS